MAPGSGVRAQTDDEIAVTPLTPPDDSGGGAGAPAPTEGGNDAQGGNPQSIIPSPSAALPEGDVVEVDKAPPPAIATAGDPEGLGVLGPNDGGFGVDLWAGTDRRVLEALLPRLPSGTSSPAVFDLARRLLLSDAIMPQALMAGGSLAPVDLLQVRLQRLAAMGEIEGLSRLLGLLPPDQLPELRRRLQIEILLTEGEDGAACAEVRQADSTVPESFWLKALIFCQIVAGERAAAELGLAILRDAGRSEDQLFLRLADAALGLQPLDPAEVGRLDPGRIRPLEFALLSGLGLPLPPKLLLESEPHTRLQLVHDEEAELVDRTVAAEWAVASSRLPAELLAGLYGRFQFTADDLDDALGRGYALPGVEARALYFQAVVGERHADIDAQAAELALERAEADGVYEAAARVVLPELSITPDDTRYSWFADTVGRALYVLGHYEEATAWLLLARQEAAISARAAVAAHRLWPYSRLAGVASISNEAGLEGWRHAQPDPNGARVAAQLGLLRVLFQALGESDAMTWIDLAMTEEDRSRQLPDASLLYALEDASYSGRLGETVLLALIVLGDTPPAEAHPLALNAVLSALMQVGLPLEARALAIEAALGNGI